MLTSVLLLAIGLALIVKGGGLFVASSVRIAGFLGVPRVVVGSTLVSLATTTPELVVSIMSGLQNESGLAVGNAVGSCICNIALILGLTAALGNVAFHPRTVAFPLIYMHALAILLFVFTLNLALSRWQGFVLIILGAAYFVTDFIRHMRHKETPTEPPPTDKEPVRAWSATKIGTTVQFLIGATLVAIGSRLLVQSSVSIASALGIPSIVIGLTVVAVGTSLPELVTALTSRAQKVSDLSVGNILGANIANLSLIVGVAAAIHPVTIDRPTQLLNFPALLITLVGLVVLGSTGRRLVRSEGVAFLAFYALYILAIVATALWAR